MFHRCLNNIKCFIFSNLFCGAMSGDEIKQELNITFNLSWLFGLLIVTYLFSVTRNPQYIEYHIGVFRV